MSIDTLEAAAYTLSIESLFPPSVKLLNLRGIRAAREE